MHERGRKKDFCSVGVMNLCDICARMFYCYDSSEVMKEFAE